MCTWIVQIVFVAFLLAGAGLTIVSLVTPAWREIHNETLVASVNKVGNTDYRNYPKSIGMFINSCGDGGGWEKCQQYFQNAPDWKKASMACMVLALAACAAAFVWSCIACFMCCCKSCLTPPLPIFAGLAFVLDVIGIAIYGAKSGEDIGNIPVSQSDFQNLSSFGYSFWCGIGAIAALFIDTLVGIVLVKTSKVSPI